MPVLAPSNTATSSRKGFKKGVSPTPKKQGGGVNAKDSAESGDNNGEVPQRVRADVGVPSEARGPMNTIFKGIFTKDVFQRIAGETSRLAHYNRRSASASQEIHTAMRLWLPHQLAKHTGSEVTKTTTKYTSTKRA
ncbi:histone H2B 1.2-like [Sciurus carolinensis]|uniref:histone H2B 1.2-like n=1 Tax=Sciurus carolinensis TaxID=30640 RepID=UPI001FB47ACD|nr:histone H2B 1.2-like [Sciurus carolinensis]